MKEKTLKARVSKYRFGSAGEGFCINYREDKTLVLLKCVIKLSEETRTARVGLASNSNSIELQKLI